MLARFIYKILVILLVSVLVQYLVLLLMWNIFKFEETILTSLTVNEQLHFFSVQINRKPEFFMPLFFVVIFTIFVKVLVKKKQNIIVQIICISNNIYFIYIYNFIYK